MSVQEVLPVVFKGKRCNLYLDCFGAFFAISDTFQH